MSATPRRKTRSELERELATIRSSRDVSWEAMREIARLFARLAISGYHPDLPPIRREDGGTLQRVVPAGSVEATELARRLAVFYLRMNEPTPLTVGEVEAFDVEAPSRIRRPSP